MISLNSMAPADADGPLQLLLQIAGDPKGATKRLTEAKAIIAEHKAHLDALNAKQQEIDKAAQDLERRELKLQAGMTASEKVAADAQAKIDEAAAKHAKAKDAVESLAQAQIEHHARAGELTKRENAIAARERRLDRLEEQAQKKQDDLDAMAADLQARMAKLKEIVA